MKWSSVGLMEIEATLWACTVKNRRQRLWYSNKNRTAWSTLPAPELTSTIYVRGRGGVPAGLVVSEKEGVM